MRALFLQAVDIMNEKQTRWFLYWIAKWALLFLCIALYTIIVARVSEAKAEKKYMAWQERWVNEYIDQREAEERGIPADPYELLLDEEAQALARVLYGIRSNSDKDLRTYCWCVLNRVDSPDYPDTLDEVIAQPSQWMRYDPENPVLESLYQIAREQLNVWHKGTTRPVSNEFVFMNWTPSDLCLRDRWEEGSRTNYWRWNQ